MRKFFSNLVRGVSEVILPFCLFFRRKAEYKPLSGRKDGIVVSLTSFPARMPRLWMTLDSLFRQKVRPDKIVLVLTENEFPGGISEVPDSVKRFQHFGLEIVFLPYNLRCHNKYHHSLQAFPEAEVITVDDDSFYRKDTISRLVKLHEKYPKAVCCNIAAVIDPESFHSYRSWKKSVFQSGPDKALVALGFAGVLYPPHIFSGALFDKDLALRLAPTSDDLWLKANELAEGIPVVCGDLFPKPVTVRGSQKESLRRVNKGLENRNDMQWKAMDEHFHLEEIIKS